MVYSKVEKLTESQERMHDEFTIYLFEVVGRKGKTPCHLTESLERRVQIFAREHVDSSFTCVYDYSDTNFLQKVLECLRNNPEWYDYSRRSGSTLTSSLEHYISFLNYRKNSKSLLKTINPDTYKEGRVSYVHAVGYERNKDARNACIDYYGCRCSVCGFDFEKVYGEIGRNFIEVHHVVPIHERKGEYDINPINDLRPVCSNCHSMIHRRNPVYSIDEIKEMIVCNKKK